MASALGESGRSEQSCECTFPFCQENSRPKEIATLLHAPAKPVAAILNVWFAAAEVAVNKSNRKSIVVMLKMSQESHCGSLSIRMLK